MTATVTSTTAASVGVTAWLGSDSSGESVGTADVVFVPGAPSALRFATEPSDTTVAGQAFATQPVVEVLDRFENVVVQDSTSSIGLALTTGEGSLAGTTTITAVGGRGRKRELRRPRGRGAGGR